MLGCEGDGNAGGVVAVSAYMGGTRGSGDGDISSSFSTLPQVPSYAAQLTELLSSGIQPSMQGRRKYETCGTKIF